MKRSGSSAWLEYRLVTPGVASSNLVHSAIICIMLLYTSMADASGKFDLGGKLDDGDFSIITSVDYGWLAGKFERDIEFNYRYSDKNNKTSTNKGLIEYKQRLKFLSYFL